MHTLIIDNGTTHLNELQRACAPATVVPKRSLINIDLPSDFQCLVLSGGTNTPTVLRHPEQYQEETSLVVHTELPILGICLGCEIIAEAFGGSLHELPQQHEGEIELTISDPELKEFLQRPTVTVHEGHRIAIKTLPKDFVVCAESAHGIEIIKHKTQPIIGLQFHPELDHNEALYRWIWHTLGIAKSAS